MSFDTFISNFLTNVRMSTLDYSTETEAAAYATGRNSIGSSSTNIIGSKVNGANIHIR